MAIPQPTDRSNPAALAQIEDHYDGAKSTITLAADVDVDFAEIDPQPFGVEGREPIQQINSFNVSWVHKRARCFKELTPISCNVHYHPLILDQILALVNIETTITNTFGGTGPSNSARAQWAAFGWLRSFIPQRLQEGVVPVAAIVIELSAYDFTNMVEAGPNYVSDQGTD